MSHGVSWFTDTAESVTNRFRSPRSVRSPNPHQALRDRTVHSYQQPRLLCHWRSISHCSFGTTYRGTACDSRYLRIFWRRHQAQPEERPRAPQGQPYPLQFNRPHARAGDQPSPRYSRCLYPTRGKLVPRHPAYHLNSSQGGDEFARHTPALPGSLRW